MAVWAADRLVRGGTNQDRLLAADRRPVLGVGVVVAWHRRSVGLVVTPGRRGARRRRWHRTGWHDRGVPEAGPAGGPGAGRSWAGAAPCGGGLAAAGVRLRPGVPGTGGAGPSHVGGGGAPWPVGRAGPAAGQHQRHQPLRRRVGVSAVRVEPPGRRLWHPAGRLRRPPHLHGAGRGNGRARRGGLAPRRPRGRRRSGPGRAELAGARGGRAAGGVVDGGRRSRRVQRHRPHQQPRLGTGRQCAAAATGHLGPDRPRLRPRLAPAGAPRSGVAGRHPQSASGPAPVVAIQAIH